MARLVMDDSNFRAAPALSEGPVGVNEIIERTETLLPGPAEALCALLDAPVPDLDGGQRLPLLWHWIYRRPTG